MRVFDWFRGKMGLPLVGDGDAAEEALTMHWSPPPENLPMCGGSAMERWTTEFEFATCKECRRAGAGVYAKGVTDR